MLEHAAPGSVIIDMSTIRPEVAPDGLPSKHENARSRCWTHRCPGVSRELSGA